MPEPNVAPASATVLPQPGPALTKVWARGDSEVAGLHQAIVGNAPVALPNEASTPTKWPRSSWVRRRWHAAGTELVVNLDYIAKRVMAVWRKRFPRW
jgi:hypothetical protein